MSNMMTHRYYKTEDYQNQPDSLEKYLILSQYTYLLGDEDCWTKSLDPKASDDYETVSIAKMSTNHLKNSLRYIKTDCKYFKLTGAGKYTEEVESLFKIKINKLEQELKKRKARKNNSY
jgi:hypothetical protein